MLHLLGIGPVGGAEDDIAGRCDGFVKVVGKMIVQIELCEVLVARLYERVVNRNNALLSRSSRARGRVGELRVSSELNR